MPSTVTVNTEGIDNLLSQITGLADYDFTPLMDQWRVVLEEDNTEGALAGLDGFGEPLKPVTYRPDPEAGSRMGRYGLEGIDYSIQPNDNLTSGHYRTLDGPPLAPQETESRIITHFETRRPENPGPGEWYAVGEWADIVSIDGTPFLGFHFRGEGNLPVRDLAHVRPKALQRARDVLHGYAVKLLRAFRAGG